MRFGQSLGLLGAQAQRADQGFLAQRLAEDLVGSLLKGFEAQAFGVKHGAIHVEDGTEYSFSLEKIID